MSRIESGQHTNSGGTGANGKTMKIVISQQPPSFVFSDEWFDVGLDVPSASDISASYTELGANLHRYVNEEILSQPAQDNKIVDLHLLIKDQPSETPLSTSDTKTVANCKIKSPVPEDGLPLKYCLKFFYRSRQTGAVLDDIKQACSIPGEKIL